MLKCLVVFYLIVIITRGLVSCDLVNSVTKIAGNRSISECVNGYRPPISNSIPDMYITTPQFVRKMGYLAEEHVVQTEDGYILTVHRIPAEPGSPPVFLQHGMLSSSFDWVVIGKEAALAFKLADQGYDVWLGNFRGSTYSRCHNKYKASNYKFWNFSWHEMGIHDLPTMITYVARTTGQKVIYIGHSMGTTSFFVMAIERPDIASQVKVMMALAPVAYLGHATSPILLIASLEKPIELVARAMGISEVLSESPFLKRVIEYACTLSYLQRRVCAKLGFFISGFNPRNFNYSLAPQIFYHIPAGSSLKIIAHYAQEYNSKRFQYYDYGARKNSRLYNSTRPPDYDVSKIAVPIGVFYSDRDLFSNSTDVNHLYNQLPNKILHYHVNDSKFNHQDYLYGIDAPSCVYEQLLSVIKNYK